jgi:hypothetical protein
VKDLVLSDYLLVVQLERQERELERRLSIAQNRLAQFPSETVADAVEALEEKLLELRTALDTARTSCSSLV